MSTGTLQWYTFQQNNSGGVFVGPPYVFVQAHSAEEANERAEGSGVVYFDDDYDIDCPCCGRRWSHAWDDDGTVAPSLYGEAVDPFDPEAGGEYGRFVSGQQSWVVYADGRVVAGRTVTR